MGATFGLNAVDWEQRVDVDRLRRERLARIKALLAESELGALLCFDMANIRYVTATHIGTWAMDKLARFSLLCRGRRADRLGLRLGRAPPRPLLPLARGPLARRHLHDARRDVAGERPRGGRGGEGAPGAGGARAARASRWASTSSSRR